MRSYPKISVNQAPLIMLTQPNLNLSFQQASLKKTTFSSLMTKTMTKSHENFRKIESAFPETASQIVPGISHKIELFISVVLSCVYSLPLKAVVLAKQNSKVRKDECK